MKRFFILLLVGMIGLTLTGCSETTEEKGPITVATMIDSEGAVLGNVLLLLLEQEGFETVDQIAFGTPDILRPALVEGNVDLIIDYTGSGQYYGAVADAEVWSDPQNGYEATRDFDLAENDLHWLTPAKANNTEMLAVNREFAEENNLETMYDLARYINDGGDVKIICSNSFASNTLGLLGYQSAYGFELTEEQLIILSHGNTTEMLTALKEGTNGVNVSLVYGTDGALNEMDMVVIEDPLNVPPVYLPTPVLRGELMNEYDELATIFEEVFMSLDLETLQGLNAKVAFGGENANDVAKKYLEDNGFLS